jgi:hypothetical protein
MQLERGTLRARREALGLNAIEVARRAGCPVEVVLRAEFGLCVPVGEALRRRLALCYDLGPMEYVRMALDAADAASRGPGGTRETQ